MTRQYYTLCKVAAELRLLCGCALAECFTQEKNTLILTFFGDDGEYTLETSLDPQWGAVFLRSDFRRARKNTLDFFTSLRGQTLRDVGVLDNERLVRLVFDNATLQLALFGAGGGNVLLTDSDNRIVEAFKFSGTTVGQIFAPEARSLPDLEHMRPELPLRKALASSRFLLAAPYADEALQAAGLKGGTPLAATSASQLAALTEAADRIREDLLTTERFYVIECPNALPMVSLRPLTALSCERREFTSISEAIRYRIISSKRQFRYVGRYKELTDRLRKVRTKTERALARLEDDKSDDTKSEERRLFGELLLNQPNTQRKGLERLTTERWEGGEVHIPLNPALTLRENAERYFEKARRAKDARAIREQRRQTFTQRLADLTSAEKDLSAVTDMDSLEVFFSQHPTLDSVMKERSTQAEHPYREFDLGEGYIVYVGRNSANNDQLTMRFAKPNDLWFHARGASGSHVVLRPVGKNRPPKYIINRTASIAAYYSKARNAKMTPVAYTYKKYVRKPRGAAVGAVVMDREVVVMVQPQLPQGREEE